MGAGEEYWFAFQDWFAGLGEGEREEFVREWPEPHGWEGFFQRILAHKKMRVR